MPLVIGLTGLAGSGKGEVSSYLVKKYNFVKLVFSDILREEAKKRELLENKNYEESKIILSKLGDHLREETGKMEVLAEMLVEKIKKDKLEKIVVDGFRAVEEVETFKKNFEIINEENLTDFLSENNIALRNLNKRVIMEESNKRLKKLYQN